MTSSSHSAAMRPTQQSLDGRPMLRLLNALSCRRFLPGRRASTRAGLAPLGVGLLILATLPGCDQQQATPAQPPRKVLTTIVRVEPFTPSVTLTGEIKARAENDLSFRFAGRIASCTVSAGDHVEAGQVLATVEKQEQQADLDAARAALQATDATLEQQSAALERQKSLLATGFTTQKAYDSALASFQAAKSGQEAARAALATAQDQFANTELKATTAGIITARNAEVGQVVQAAQAVFTLAQDGPRDAVFEVYERIFAEQPGESSIAVSLLTNPRIVARGVVREVAPAFDQATGTVKVKIGLDTPPPGMTLGAAVSGLGLFKARDVIMLPWTALSATAGKPAIWVVDPKTHAASPKPVVIERSRTGDILISSGLAAGDIAVTAGSQFLSDGEIVSGSQGAKP